MELSDQFPAVSAVRQSLGMYSPRLALTGSHIAETELYQRYPRRAGGSGWGIQRGHDPA